MRAHKPLTPEQTRKAISMHKDGAIVRLGKCSECREVIRTMNRTISCS